MREKDEIQLLNSVGEKIRDLRNQKNLSQATLSYDANIPKNQIGRIERGDINTSILTLNKICKALEIPLIELFKI
ncbi:MAG: XRE family transcriptional regulator [Flavobacterium sp.]|nr:MAG: XRE family transcriptional regulator [Flavobacterium sp.]